MRWRRSWCVFGERRGDSTHFAILGRTDIGGAAAVQARKVIIIFFSIVIVVIACCSKCLTHSISKLQAHALSAGLFFAARPCVADVLHSTDGQSFRSDSGFVTICSSCLFCLAFAPAEISGFANIDAVGQEATSQESAFQHVPQWLILLIASASSNASQPLCGRTATTIARFDGRKRSRISLARRALTSGSG